MVCHFLLQGIFFFNLFNFWLFWVFSLDLVSVSGGYSLVAVCRLLIAAVSLVAEHRL